MTEMVAVLICTTLIVLLSQVSKRYVSHKLAASTILIAIAFIYVGFALQGNTIQSILIEVIAAIVFYLIAIIGYMWHEKILPLGIILHGLWDIAHHFGVIRAHIPDYYPVFCLTIDLLLGIYFWIIFSRRKE